ncbi:MAG: peptidoglycan editing factor PgeF [Candidatus Omnitrophica bacterium]|nr:peptidoglycan editing factor PgeF [Candidatus Omnitrophota bacterium]
MNNSKNVNQICKIENLFPKNIIAAFSVGKVNYDYRAEPASEVLKNRKIFFSQLDVELAKAVFPMQVHKADVAKVDERDRGRGEFSFEHGIAHTDALITNVKEVVLCLLTADCLPIIFHELSGKAIGIVHAGWKGIRLGVIEKTIQAMVNEFGVKPQDLKAFFAPAIGSCCYEVGLEFLDIFPDDISSRNQTRFLDIKNLAKKKCLNAGILPGSIKDVSVCTKCSNEKFFSYRSGDYLKRMLTIVAIKAG